MVVLLAAACSSVGNDGTKGTGGAGSKGGAGGGDAGWRSFPSCWQELTADCPITATCTIHAFSAWVVGECMSDATRLDIASVRKKDGTLCYTVEAKFIFTGTCESADVRWDDPDELVWKNPAGDVVATGSATANSLSIACPGGAVQSCTIAPGCPAYDNFCVPADP